MHRVPIVFVSKCACPILPSYHMATADAKDPNSMCLKTCDFGNIHRVSNEASAILQCLQPKQRTLTCSLIPHWVSKCLWHSTQYVRYRHILIGSNSTEGLSTAEIQPVTDHRLCFKPYSKGFIKVVCLQFICVPNHYYHQSYCLPNHCISCNVGFVIINTIIHSSVPRLKLINI